MEMTELDAVLDVDEIALPWGNVVKCFNIKPGLVMAGRS